MIRDVVTSEGFSLEALRTGDRAEFARFVEAYSGVIYRLALKILDNPQDAEDVLQETFIKAFGHLADFDGRSKLSTWLYRIATNEALMVLRRRKINPLSIDEPDESTQDEQEPMEIMDWCCLPEGEKRASTWTAPLISYRTVCGWSSYCVRLRAFPLRKLQKF
jgi:RNA polymerase sigma-70 factor (ECF subfamily)